MEELDCYRKINTDATVLADYIRDTAAQYADLPWMRSFGFRLLPLDLPIIFEKSPFLKELNEKIEITNCSVLRMVDNDHYLLHKDDNRGCTINMIIQNVDSSCDFIDEEKRKVLRLDYQPNTMYLFNTQQYHQISNYRGTRLLMTTSFKHKKEDLDYTTVLATIEEMNY